MTPDPVAIDLGEDRAVSGLWMKPEDAAAVLVLAHGALHVFHERGHQDQHAGRANAQDGQVRQVPRARTLTVGARFLQFAL